MNSNGCTGLTDLPNDILFEIAWFLRPQDLFSMTATSRGLRSLFLEDLVWRQAYSEWPLDLPASQVPNDLDGSDLRRLYVKSLRLESMWGNNHAPSKVGEISTPAIVHSIQFLGSQWLLTLGGIQNQALGGMITLWSLEDLHHVHAACSFDIVTPHCYGLVAAWRKGIIQIVIAVYTSDSSMQVQSMSLQQGIWVSDHVLTLKNVPGALNIRNQFHPHICDYMVAWCTKAHGAAYVWLINSITKRCFSTQLDSIFTSADVPVALICIELGCLVVVTGSWVAEDIDPAQVIHVLRLPPGVLDKDGHTRDQSTPPLEDTDAVPQLLEELALELISCYESPHFQTQPSNAQSVRVDVSLDSHHELTVVQHRDGANPLAFNRFHIDGHRGLQPSGNTIFLDAAGHNEINVSLCRSGRRGFYTAFETSENDPDHRFVLRKFATPHQVEVVPIDELIREGHMFSCVNFDDATGRFCVATWGFHPFHSGMAVSDFIE